MKKQHLFKIKNYKNKKNMKNKKKMKNSKMIIFLFVIWMNTLNSLVKLLLLWNAIRLP